ncbi:hypothetical protein BKA70DRAFT_1222623 [Coprinopsis sp. MPI-PUGE-AT-0042]|nr:hypothetical protein BKA70DRAFT_1222623 [Coprinopsis sp. MPI-PUGE-AT-0042]
MTQSLLRVSQVTVSSSTRPFQEPLAYWSDNQDFLLPSAAFSGQQTYNRSFVLLPFSSNASQSACNLFLDTRSSHCGPADLFLYHRYSTPHLFPTCDEPSQDSVSSKPTFERELHASPLLKLLIHWYSPRGHLALRPHRFQPQRRNPSATTPLRHQKAAQGPPVPLFSALVRVNPPTDPNLGDSDSTTVHQSRPCRKNGSRAFDVALRTTPNSDDERKPTPQGPRAKSLEEVRWRTQFVTPVSAEDLQKILEASTV